MNAIQVWRPALDTVYCMDALQYLRQIPDNTVHCCVTSPPYYGLRDYGTASWEGGDPVCEHRIGNQVQDNKAPGAIVMGVRPGVDASRCKKCGAVRVDTQIGLEDTPDAYVARMVELFAEVRRVLREDGTCWLNLGDSYVGGGGYAPNAPSNIAGSLSSRTGVHGVKPTGSTRKAPGLKAKDLMMIPHRVAIALQADGWYVRSDIVWHKPNPMPESVTDRPTKAHEYIFLLSKAERYFYNADAIREGYSHYTIERMKYPKQAIKDNPKIKSNSSRKDSGEFVMKNGRNKRDVWAINTQPYPDAHFAVFPHELPRTCILAGCPPGGIVLDPFMGSGTTALVAKGMGRHYMGCDLNPEYVRMAQLRFETGITRLNAKEPADIRELPLFSAVGEA